MSPVQRGSVISVPLRATLLVGFIWAFSVNAQGPLNETRSTLEKWVEARQLTSKAKSDWQSDKELLEQTSHLFERELASVEEQMIRLGTNSSQVEKERVEANELRLKSNLRDVSVNAQRTTRESDKLTKLRQNRAPSISAASVSERSTLERAARRIRNMKGVHCQISQKMMAG